MSITVQNSLQIKFDKPAQKTLQSNLIKFLHYEQQSQVCYWLCYVPYAPKCIVCANRQVFIIFSFIVNLNDNPKQQSTVAIVIQLSTRMSCNHRLLLSLRLFRQTSQQHSIRCNLFSHTKQFYVFIHYIHKFHLRSSSGPQN